MSQSLGDYTDLGLSKSFYWLQDDSIYHLPTHVIEQYEHFLHDLSDSAYRDTP
jgi:hypothetical protein